MLVVFLIAISKPPIQVFLLNGFASQDALVMEMF